MTDKKTSEEVFKEWLEDADPVVKEMFPTQDDVLKVAKTLKEVRFRTRYNCHVDDAEHPDPVSVVAPGRSESLDHLVQRLTGRPNPTSLDLTHLAQANGEFEDPTDLSDEEIDERMERVVAVGDKLDAEEALMETISQLPVAGEQGVVSAEEQSVANATTSDPARSEPQQATQSGATEFA